MSSRRPPRPSGPNRGPGSGGGGADDSPAQTNLGLLLQRAMEAAQQSSQTGAEPAESQEEAEELRETQLCANCWNASTFKDEQGKMMARCAKDLWVRRSFTLEDLNGNRVRRWYANCPEYDDTE